MKKVSEDQIDQEVIQDAQSTPVSETLGFNHDSGSVSEAIGINRDTFEKNIDRFCDTMNDLNSRTEGDTQKVSIGVEVIESIFSPRELAYLAYTGLDQLNRSQQNPLEAILAQISEE